MSNVFQVDIMLHQEFTNLAVLYLTGWSLGRDKDDSFPYSFIYVRFLLYVNVRPAQHWRYK